MKKNFAMRVAACLLVVTMLSLCMVSYTYAKYTTADNDQSSAQVAHWGVKVDVSLNDLFEAEYDTTDVTVKAVAAGYELLAPGTTKTTAAAIKITGKPEVSTQILAQVTVNLDNWDVDGSYYCPIIFKVNDVAVAAGANADEYEANIKAAIEAAIKGNTNGKYDPNADNLAHTVNVTWEWPFETGADADEKAANNIKDTKLGDAATKATFGLSIVVTVEQVD